MSDLIPTLRANLPLVLLSVTLLLGGIWAYRLWREMHGEEDGDAGDSPLGLLDHVRAAHAAGEIDDAEFERVRQRLFKTGPGGARTLNAGGSAFEEGQQRAADGDASEPPRAESGSPAD